MRNLTAIFCLTLVILLGSAGNSESADFQKGMWAYSMKDYATALRELKPLAEQGNATAQYYVGAMYAFGNGVHKDHVFAHMWANIALANGNPTGTRLINFVEKKMTPSEIKTAQDLTRECVRKKYEGCGEVKFEDLVKKSKHVGVDASASVLNLKCTNSKNTFSTTYEVDIENKTIIHKTSLVLSNNKKFILNRKPQIISFEEPFAITFNKTNSGYMVFKVFNFDKKTYSQSGHSEMCLRCAPDKKPSSQLFTCVKSD